MVEKEKKGVKSAAEILVEYLELVYFLNYSFSGNAFGYEWFRKLDNIGVYAELPRVNGDIVAHLFYVDPELFSTPFISRDRLTKHLQENEPHLTLLPLPIAEPYVQLDIQKPTPEIKSFSEIATKNKKINRLYKLYKKNLSEIYHIASGIERNKKELDYVGGDNYFKFWFNESKFWSPGYPDQAHERAVREQQTEDIDDIQYEQLRLSSHLDELYKTRKGICNDLDDLILNIYDVRFSKLKNKISTASLETQSNNFFSIVSK